MKKSFHIMLILIAAIVIAMLTGCSLGDAGSPPPKDEIKITYNLNFEGSKSETVVQYKGENFKLKSFTRQGYFLAGWANSSDAENPDYKDGQSVMFESDKTFYALWVGENDVVSLTLYLTPDFKNVKTIKVPKHQNYTLPLNTVSLSGKVFLGWTNSIYSTNISYSDGGVVSINSSDLTLYSIWYSEDSPDLCKFTLNKNDGSGETETQYLIKGSSSYKLKKNSFERDGYVFDGWATTPDADEPEFNDCANASNSLFGTGSDFVNNKNLYAVWLDKSKLKIKFYRYDSSTDTEYSCIYVDMVDNVAEYTLPECMFDNYSSNRVFSGWKKYEGGYRLRDGGDYFPGETYTFNSETVRKICYAACVVSPGSSFVKEIRYFANKNSEPYIQYYDWYFQNEVAILNNMFKDEDGEFLGWVPKYTDEKPKYSPLERFDTFSGADKPAPTYLYACFSKDITLTLDAHNSTGEKTTIVVKSYKPTELPKDVFVDDNKKLAAWGKTVSTKYSIYNNNYDLYKFNKDHYFIEDTTLYAIWVSPLKITFDSNGGDQEPVVVDSYESIETYCPVEFTNNGYKFIGFSTKQKGVPEFSGENCKERYVASNGTKKPVIYYAVWSKNATIKMRSGIEDFSPDYDISVETNVKYKMPNTLYVIRLAENEYESWSVPDTWNLKSWKIYAGDTLTEEIQYYMNGAYSNKTDYLVIYNDTTAIEATWYKPMTLILHANDGTEVTKEQIISCDYTGYRTRIEENTFVRDGYKFLGWDTNPESTYPRYYDCEESPYENGETMDLYAVWKKIN